jgi:murein DD-endopeptidase MepM/ murein hydrolase activator NlpD
MEQNPITVDFPLRGEWVAYHTPAERVPSHGTDDLGQRFAFDFLRIDSEHPGWKVCQRPMWRYIVFGAPLSDFYGWGEPIHAPFNGKIIAALDGWPERGYLHILREVGIVLKNELMVDVKRLEALRGVLGNYLIIKMDGSNVYALIAHARTGSIRVTKGDDVSVGTRLADVGHSGNSTAPHLHFHLMDGPNILSAQGIPCVFRNYEVRRDGNWLEVVNAVPAKREFIRSV